MSTPGGNTLPPGADEVVTPPPPDAAAAGRKQAIQEALRDVKADPHALGDAFVSVYDRGFQAGFSLGIRMEARPEKPAPRKKGFWES